MGAVTRAFLALLVFTALTTVSLAAIITALLAGASSLANALAIKAHILGAGAVPATTAASVVTTVLSVTCGLTEA